MTAELESRIAALEARVERLEANVNGSAGVERREKSARKPTPREFLLDHAPQTDNDKTLVAGYYLEIIGGVEYFDFDDIERFYSAAKEAAPANRRDPPYQNVKKDYFRKVGKRAVGKTARNRWALTNLGIARVEGGFAKK